MGKLIKKTVIFCLGVMMFGIMPTMVDAAEFKWGSPTKENNVTRIPVKMVITDTDAVSNFKLGCAANDLDVTCEVKQLSSQTTVQYLEGLYTYIGTEPGANFPVGEYELVEVVLTNNDTMKKSEVEFSLKNAAIGGVSQSLSSKYLHTFKLKYYSRHSIHNWFALYNSRCLYENLKPTKFAFLCPTHLALPVENDKTVEQRAQYMANSMLKPDMRGYLWLAPYNGG